MNSEEIIPDDLSDVLSEDDLRITLMMTRFDSDDDSIIEVNRRKFPIPIISSSDSESYISEEEGLKGMQRHLLNNFLAMFMSRCL